MNIVVICADTFRYDHLGALKLQPVVTPCLDQLARASASFADFRVCSFPTVVNRIEVFSGRCAFPRVGWGALPYEFPVLSQVFGRHGFRTALMADNVQVTKPEYHFSRGFDVYRRVRGQQHDDWHSKRAPMSELPCPVEKLDASPKRLARYRRNNAWFRQQGTNATETLFREAIGWLRNPPSRFFLWIDSFDPHEPWDAPRRYRELYPWDDRGAEVIWPHSGRCSHFYSEPDLANMRSLYRAEITQTDYWIGQLMECLDRQKLLSDTAVIFCSDHGHYFGEHDMIGKFMKPGMDRPTTLYEEVGHLPLLIRHPDRLGAGSTIPGLCQPQDLFPTLLELAAIPSVPWIEGRSLVPRLHGKRGEQTFAVSGAHPQKRSLTCLTIWTEDWSLVYSPLTGLASAELFNQRTDPLQHHNVMAAHPAVAQHLYDLMVGWLDGLKIPEARLQQLLHNQPFGRSHKLRYKTSLWRKRLAYHWRFSNYQRPMPFVHSLRAGKATPAPEEAAVETGVAQPGGRESG
jgi:arylsulfatase A-like enzyme